MENTDVSARLQLKVIAALRGEGVLSLPANVAEAGPEHMQQKSKF